jgi:C-terminal processing protease CtpA/Prc
MTVIIGSVTKASKDDKVGIAFTQATLGAPLIIKLIREDSLFSKTDLTPGLLVLNVCGVDVVGQSAKHAADILRSAEGEVTVVAAPVKRGVAATAEKEIADMAVGVSLKKDPKLGVIVISQVTDGGLFDETGLAKGQVVVAINGEPCPATTTDAIKIIKDTVGTLSIVAEDVEEDVEEPAPATEQAPAVEETPRALPTTEGKEADQGTVSTTADEANEAKDPADEAEVKEEQVKQTGLFESIFSTCLN